jgi:uncharacterized protein (DUF1697 family)
MHTYIALLRGINVGGKNPLPMKELVALLEDLDCRNVKTYIQSGNAVFESRERDTSLLSKRIGDGIRNRRGFEPHVLLLGIEEMERAIEENPFPQAEADPKTLHVSFLASAPENPDLTMLENLKRDSERFALIDRFFYLHAPEGISRSKLATNAERLLGVSMTDRNWRTLCRVRDLARELD